MAQFKVKLYFSQLSYCIENLIKQSNKMHLCSADTSDKKCVGQTLTPTHLHSIKSFFFFK